MSFIEGVGDEVTVFVVVLFVLILSGIVTFLLNNAPSAENHNISQASVHNSSSPIQDQEEQTINEENAEETSLSNSNGATNINHCEEIETNENESTNIDNEVQSSEDFVNDYDFNADNEIPSSEDLVNSRMYPDINDMPSAPAAEDVNETGENTATETGNIRIRLKYLDDTERIVQSNPTMKLGDFKRVHFVEDLANNKTVRLIFSGQLLQDNCTLQFYGVTNNCVIHVQILQAQTQQNSSTSQNAELDLSHLLWPLLSVILGICWILYFKYPEFFNVMSLGILFLFTGSFVYFYNQVEHQ